MPATTIALQVLTGAVIAMLAAVAIADPVYPNRPIRIVTPYAPGGSTSVTGRLLGEHFTSRWRQNVVVDSRGGGNTTIGTAIVAKSLPDGYTLLLTTTTHSILSNVMKTPYDPVRDFAPVATLGIQPHVLVLHPSVPASTVQELIALAKANPDQLTFASSSSGGTSHMAGEVFNMLAGVKIRHIPYKGGGPATIDLIGGHVQMFFSVPVNIVGHVQSGRLKALAVTGDTRLTALPQTPTFAEGGLRGLDVKTWHGVLAPAGTSRTIVDKLSAEIGALLAMPSVQEKLEALGLTTMISTPDQFGAMIKSEIGLYMKVVRAANIRIE
ncbi:MAG: Bug family tripartite tricarboxylate transporter substrate binding protein [Burkholderiales bacterium]